MKKHYIVLCALFMSVIFTNPAHAVTVSGSAGYERDFVSLKKVFFTGNLATTTVNIVLGNDFTLKNWSIYDLSGEKSFVRRDWSLIKKASLSEQIASSMSVNLYNYGSSYFDFVHKGDAVSLEANAAMKVSPSVSLFGGVECLTIIRKEADFSTVYVGVRLERGKLFIKPRLQWLTNDSPFVRVDVGVPANVLGIPTCISTKFVFAGDRKPMAHAAVEVPF